MSYEKHRWDIVDGDLLVAIAIDAKWAKVIVKLLNESSPVQK